MKSAKGRGGRELGNLIPPDDGFDTVCYQVTIPNTPEWRTILFTLIYKFSEGRYWKRTATGRRIVDVQETGLQILDSLTECEELTQDQINQILDAINNQCRCCGMSSNKCCCNDAGNQVTDSVNVGDPVVDYPLDLTGETQADPNWFNWKCEACDFTIDVLREVAQQTAAYSPGDEPVVNEYGELVFQILRVIFPTTEGASNYVTDLWWLLLSFSTLVIEETTAEVATNIALYLDENREVLKNVIFCEATPNAQKDALKAHVSTAPIPPLNRWILKTFIDLFAFQFMWIEESLRPDLTAYPRIIAKEVSCNCNMAGDFDLPFGWIVVPMTVDVPASGGGVNGGFATFLQNMWEIDGVPPTGDNAGYDIDVNPPQYTDMDLVPNADIGGFFFEIVLVNISGDPGDGFGKNNALPASGMSPTTDEFPMVSGDNFAGVRSDNAELQSWLTLATNIQFKEFDSKLHEEKVFIRWLMFGGDDTTNFQADIVAYAIVRAQFV